MVADAKAQAADWTGHCRLWAVGERIGVVEVGSPAVYPGLRDYRRTLAMVDLDERDSYLVDFFRVDGGADHVLSFHAGEGEAQAEGPGWVRQREGTYAGEEVPFGVHYDGAPDGRYRGSGFSYLYEVSRAQRPRLGLRVDWNLMDTWSTRMGAEPVHVRLHALSRLDEAATAWGDPPQNKPGNPRRLRYLLQRRRAAKSLFLSVIEPYSGDRPCLSRVERIDLGLADDDLTAGAVAVHTAAGGVDRILSSDDPERLFDLGAGVCAAARFAAIRMEPGGAVTVLLAGGTHAAWPGGKVTASRREYTGTVEDFHRAETGSAWIDVAADLPLGDGLRGAQLCVHNDGVRDACYEIQAVAERPGGLRRVELWDTTFIRGIDGEGKPLFDLGPGDAFDVQSVLEIRVEGGAARALRAAADWRYVPGLPTRLAPPMLRPRRSAT